ncbi:protocatechuate 3,4-dioxygenase subunit alpha [Azospirillum rugosum]|uniref:Protocatechuate 3,4-dioxygenase alpha subunit n=1 Tax=Azospirillum rugosum TaxID=416170 RepID=A0ABS4SV92_9PROT|nr:protocatechuate 3,4-dioxygenase subunit alpha [Azospirillum rugosum]MBP2296480.1 protocatechuate 3,4-dioxygenase alpha subunit [Azospirillum rugosum]MDQ0530001.1 protocatechuate 3,4-dioxygenase alpha subunit [Azospirillum rugosum]
MLKQTPSQTVGPYFAYALTPQPYGRVGLGSGTMVDPDTRGERIRIEGRVFDGTGAPVVDAVIELWQANAAGRYRHPADTRDQLELDPHFTGFGRTGTDGQGLYWFDTVKPGALGDGQAPHVNVTVLARGMLSHAFTRLYFHDEAGANAEDALLQSVPADRRATLVARRAETAGGVAYRFDIHLQGDDETVFFDA